MSDPIPFLVSSVSLFTLASTAPILLGDRNRFLRSVSMALSMAGSAAGIRLSLAYLKNPSPLDVVVRLSYEPFQIHIGMDRLSAFFVLVICAVSLCVSLYSIGYMNGYGGRPNIRSFYVLYNVFIASMVAVVLAKDVFTFLLAWEVMSVTSYFLVVFEGDKQENLKSGFVYLVMTHIGTAFITAAFLLFYRTTGSLSFAAFPGAEIGPGLRNAIFALAVIGFGTKAGLMPLHVWLPKAHPAAPSNVSALMSGLMVKMGIYGLVRFGVSLLGSGPEWWGICLIGVGAVSALVGAVLAAVEQDIKRLLAYSTIENVGIIAAGLGLSALSLSLGNTGLAVFCLVASLLHTANHAIFKSLLFMVAGSVVHSCHTRNMNAYGGLLRSMPYTGLFFLVGAMAISALPPFNGFTSEWMTLQSVIQVVKHAGVPLRIFLAVCVAALAMAGAVALACFVKAFGVGFLALPRSESSRHAHESGKAMLISMAVLATLCLLLGLVPGFAVTNLRSVSAETLDITDDPPSTEIGLQYAAALDPGVGVDQGVVESAAIADHGVAVGLGVGVGQGVAVDREAAIDLGVATDRCVVGLDTSADSGTTADPGVAMDPASSDGSGVEVSSSGPWLLSSDAANSVPGVVAGLIALVAGISWSVVRLFFHGGRRVYSTWDCGFSGLDARNEYSATGFSDPIRVVFSAVLSSDRADERIGSSRYFPSKIRHSLKVSPRLEHSAYELVVNRLMALAIKVKTIQMGSVHAYLSYILLTLLGLTVYLR